MVQSVRFAWLTFLQLRHHIQCLNVLICSVCSRCCQFFAVVTSAHYCITWLWSDVMTKFIYRPFLVGAFSHSYIAHSQSYGVRKACGIVHACSKQNPAAHKKTHTNCPNLFFSLTLLELFTSMWHLKTIHTNMPMRTHTHVSSLMC